MITLTEQERELVRRLVRAYRLSPNEADLPTIDSILAKVAS
jgi:hypothetical protein